MPTILVHGGVNSGTYEAVGEGLERAAQAGYQELPNDPLSAVEEAVKALESDPKFNSGYGAVLDANGDVTLDSAMMEGGTGKVGSVGAVGNIPHPVSVAREILKSDSEVMLVGSGATDFARNHGQEVTDRVYPEQVRSWEEANESMEPGAKIDPFTGQVTCDTVGCVVLDDQGNLVAGTSTGGSFYKTPGRVGDSAIPGAGLFASSRSAVVCSGRGESFIELLLAKRIDDWVNSRQRDLQAAVSRGLGLLEREKGSKGGILALDSYGNAVKEHNCDTFPVAGVRNGQLFQL